MLLGRIFEGFAAESAISVMTRGVMQNALSASAIDALFEQTAEHQYTRELLFSTLVDLVSVVVCDSRRSVNAAYQVAADRIHGKGIVGSGRGDEGGGAANDTAGIGDTATFAPPIARPKLRSRA